MLTPAMTLNPLILPTPDQVPAVRGQVNPLAKASFNHLSGSVGGNVVSYGDVQAGAWYVGKTGWDTRNHRGRLRRRPLSGHEDTDETSRR